MKSGSSSNIENLSGDKCGLRASNVTDCIRNIGRLAVSFYALLLDKPVEQDVRSVGLNMIVPNGIGANQTRKDDIGGDALAGFHRGGASESYNRRFRRYIDAEAGIRKLQSARRRVDDSAVSRLVHVRQNSAREEKASVHVDVHDSAIILRGMSDDRDEWINGGEVNEDMDLTELDDHPFDEIVDFGVGANIADVDRRLSAFFGNLLSHIFQLFFLNIHQYNRCALRSEKYRSDFANSLSRAGDEHDLPSKLVGIDFDLWNERHGNCSGSRS
jgi:hypothetical protein